MTSKPDFKVTIIFLPCLRPSISAMNIIWHLTESHWNCFAAPQIDVPGIVDLDGTQAVDNVTLLKSGQICVAVVNEGYRQ